MIWFSSPGGRTGNQLFQVAFLSTIRRSRERVLTSQFQGFLRLFPGHRWLSSIDRPSFVRLVDRLLNPLIYHVLVRTRFVCSWIEADNVLRYRSGLFSRLCYVRGYFQNQSWWSEAPVDLRLSEQALDEARRFLSLAPQNRAIAFLHLRRGDYLEWTVLGKNDPTLPMKYYENAVERIRSRWPSVYFVVVGDDPNYAESELSWLGEYLVSRQTPLVDLAIMSLCSIGVLSNSTLAWWGGYWMRSRDLVLAPEMWLGYKSHQEYPKGITPSWAEVVPVKEWHSER